jgi:branched-subunit amino acid aminotransferase/4-amino-4-deoxychorismate lyase
MLLAVAVGGRGLVDPNEPVFAADDEALLRGGAAFETVRVYGGLPFLLDRHLERLAFSARALALPPPAGAELLVDLVLAAAPPDHALRIYRTDQLLIATAAALPSDLEDERARGMSLATVERRASALLAGVKSTSYAESFAARRAVDADDVVFVSGDAVQECATANVWWRRGNELFTPAVSPGVLTGVTRGFLLEHEAANEGAFPPSDLLEADEVFTTSSIREVMPVVTLDGRPVGDGRPGPAAARLQSAIRLHSTQ